MSTRAAPGFESEGSGLGPGPGPGPRRKAPDCGKLGKPQSQKLEPSDGSCSKCLEKGYGKPLKPGRRPLLNFCKRMVRRKEKPSNCVPCPDKEPEESFWDYLFKLDDKKLPEPATCRVAQRHKEACRRTDPRLCDPRYRCTDGDVLFFTEAEKARCCTSGVLQPRSPPDYKPPKAVACRRIVEIACSPYPVSRAEAKSEDEGEREARCSGPRAFRIPYEEFRPPRRPRAPFSCDRGARGTNVAPPMSIDRSTCGGRSVGEYLAEATIRRAKSETSFKRIQNALDSKCEPTVNIKNRSRIQRLQQLTKHANCGKKMGASSASSARDKTKRNISTDARCSI